MKNCLLWLAGICGVVGVAQQGTASDKPTPAEAGKAFFDQVRPILTGKCLTCHGPDKKRGGLDLSRWATALTGGDSGPALAAGNAKDSLLYQKLAKREMPPQNPLSAEQVEAFRRWIDAGAPFEGEPLTAVVKRGGADWWSLRPVKRSSLPAVRDPSWRRTPIDAFILARLDAAGLKPAPEADRATLIRRATFDLLGLPPTPEEIQAFVRDPAPDAYERLIDRLLASPHYGERWARHWLDVVRFAESHGYEMNTLRPTAWPYRDYVIRAFNNDTPYPRFVLEQLAGDTLKGADWRTQSATGFLVGGAHDMVGNETPEGKLQQRMDDLDDMITAVSTTFLGLTAHCARCHDHKFDPIPQQDYYRLQALLAGVQHTERGLRLPIMKLPTALKVYAGTFTPPGPTHLLQRGDPMQKGTEVVPAGLSAVRPSLILPANASEPERRLALARWLGHPDNPLPARVMVNRVWHYHFGQGIVTTPSDFGYNGDRPSHPELLDWLASEYVQSGWRLKPLHRLILLSSTYRQSGRADDKALSRDRNNRLLWRMTPRRLEAESLRDAILAASGQLDRRMGGSGYNPWEKNTNYVVVFKPKAELGPEEFRRMVYQFKPRSQQDPTFGVFDCPDAALARPRRTVSTTVLQALNLLNGPFQLRQAELFAARLLREAGDDPAKQAERAFWLAFGRAPAAQERAAAVALIRAHGTAALGRAMYNANEFLYVD